VALRSADITKTLTESKPFHAVAGAGDLAVEKIRETQARLGTFKVEPTEIRERLQASANVAREGVQDLPAQAQTFATTVTARAVGVYGEVATRATDVYEGLATRGKSVVGRIRRQKATQDMKSEAQKTATRVKATRTTARKSADSTRRSAKATGTSATRTAQTAAKAAGDAADKVGTPTSGSSSNSGSSSSPGGSSAPSSSNNRTS
jgi:heparin binding hemagglutinin HbhA